MGNQLQVTRPKKRPGSSKGGKTKRTLEEIEREEFKKRMKAWTFTDYVDISSDEEPVPTFQSNGTINILPSTTPQTVAVKQRISISSGDEDRSNKAAVAGSSSKVSSKPEIVKRKSIVTDPEAKAEVKIHTKSKKLFAEISAKCLAADNSVEMKQILKGLSKKVSKADKNSKKTEHLQKLLKAVLKNVTESPKFAACHLEMLFDQLSSNSAVHELTTIKTADFKGSERLETVEEENAEAQKKRTLRDLKAGLADLLNRVDDCDEAKILMRSDEIYKTIQEVSGSRHTKLKYKGSDFSQFNLYVTNLINSGEFDFEKIFKKLRRQNIEHRFGLTDEQAFKVVEQAFEEIINKKKKRRLRALEKKFKLLSELDGCEDPTVDDVELLNKLNANAAKAEARMNCVLGLAFIETDFSFKGL